MFGEGNVTQPLPELWEEAVVVPPLGRLGPAAGHEIGPRRAAQGCVAVVAIEDQSLRRASINIGCNRAAIVIAAEARAYVVTDDKQDVHSLSPF